MSPAEPRAPASGILTVEADEDDCQVCLRELADQPHCPTCGWQLHGDYRLGGVTPEAQRDFDARLEAAQRRFDLAASVRAGGDPQRMVAFLRGGPPQPGELEEAASAQAGPEDEAATARDAAMAAAGTGAERGGVVVIELDEEGIGVARFAADAAVGLLEQAAREHRAWQSLLPMLSADPDERRFELAGGIGVRRLPIRAAGERLADALPASVATGGERVVLLNRLPGWGLPELVLDLLRARNQGATVVRRPAPRDAPRDLAVQSTDRITAFAAAGRFAVAGTGDGALTGWALPGGDQVVTGRPLHEGRMTALDVAPDGTVVSGGRDGVVRQSALGSQDPARPLARHTAWVNQVQLRAGVVFSLGDDELVRRTSLRAGSDTADSAYPLQVGWSAASALAVDRRATTVAVGGGDGAVGVWHGTTGEPLDRVMTGAGVESLAFQPDGDVLVVGGADGTVRLYALPGGALVRYLSGHLGPVRSVAVTPGGWVATADEAHVVRLWSPDGVALPVGSHDEAVRGLSFLGNGQLASAGADGLVRAWRVETG
jgi:hypothetical protein